MLHAVDLKVHSLVLPEAIFGIEYYALSVRLEKPKELGDIH